MRPADHVEAVRSGALAGSVATTAMSAVMFAAKRAGLMGQMPPEKITASALDEMGAARGRRTQDALSSLAHLAFGAGAGAVFVEGLALAGWRRRALPIGVLYGTAVWALAYAGPVPALGIMAPPHHDRPGRPQSMLLAHWIYGATLGLMVRGAGPR